MKEKQLRLQVTSLIPDNSNEWAGISGAALFVENCLVGVITETNKSFKEKALWATPISLVADNKEFCSLILNDHNGRCIDLIALPSGTIIEGGTVPPRYAENLTIKGEEELNQLVDFAKRTTLDQDDNNIDLIEFIRGIPSRNTKPKIPFLSVILKGSQGAGKTTFLSGLYALLVSEYSDRKSVV